MRQKFIVVLFSTLLFGCSLKTVGEATEQLAITRVNAPFAPGSITVAVQGDPDLNSLKGIANSCTILIIQSQEVDTLRTVLSDQIALKSLFNGNGTQNDILKVDYYAAMPGQNTTLHIDRSENARFFAIIAGYYPFPKRQHMVLAKIPVETTRFGLLIHHWKAELMPIKLKLRLGGSSIISIDGENQEPFEATIDSELDKGS